MPRRKALGRTSGVKTFLVFNGLDTFADVSFCGEHIASTDNQFRQWRFDILRAVAACCQTDAPELEVPNSALDIYRVGQLNNLPPDQGADWVLNCSIDALGTIPSGARLSYRIAEAESGLVVASGRLQDVTSAGNVITGSTTLSGAAYRLWWPAGMGDQSLYNITVDVVEGGRTLASVTKRTGFRTIVLNMGVVTEQQLAQGIAPGNNCRLSTMHHDIDMATKSTRAL